MPQPFPIPLVAPWLIALLISTVPLPVFASQPATDIQSRTAGIVEVTLNTRTISDELAVALTVELEAVLQERVDAAGLSDADPKLEVIVLVSYRQPRPETPLIVINAYALIDDEVVARGEVQGCMDCGAEELIDRTLAILPAVATVVEALAGSGSAEGPEEAPSPPLTPKDAGRSVGPLGPVGYVGISINVVGLGVLIGGAVLLARDDKLVSSSGETHELISYKAPGWALLGTGLGLSIAGEVLLGIDLGLLSRPSEHPGRSVVTVTPQVGSVTGIQIQGQF